MGSFFAKRFLDPGILTSIADRLLFKNQTYIAYINDDLVQAIYPEVFELDRSTWDQRKRMISYAMIVPKLGQFVWDKTLSYKNMMLNSIRNVPFKIEYNSLFEVQCLYKYNIKMMYTDTKNVAFYMMLYRKWLKNIGKTLNETGSMQMYRNLLIFLKNVPEDEQIKNNVEVEKKDTNSFYSVFMRLVNNTMTMGTNYVNNMK